MHMRICTEIFTPQMSTKWWETLKQYLTGLENRIVRNIFQMLFPTKTKHSQGLRPGMELLKNVSCDITYKNMPIKGF